MAPTPAEEPTATVTPPAEPIELKVLFAGSLIIPFEALEKVFEAQYPEIDVLMEGHGSIQVIRHVTELGQLVDVAALADYTLVPSMMYEHAVPETGEPYADWTIRFATNRMALAYTDRSLYAEEVGEDNWYQVIARDDVRLGLSDPRFDAAGYRGLMALQLAEAAYGRVTILENVLMGRFVNAITTQEEEGSTAIQVPELLQPKPSSNIVIRSYSVQLIALLQAGEIDYSFAYESVAKQHDLPYVVLPDSVNLGSEAYADEYGRVSVALEFQRFATVPPQFVGEVISYGITIPSNAPHPEAAVKFVAFLLGPEGRAVMEAHQHPLLSRYQVDRPGNLPATLRGLVEATNE
jgi:molybdate/tungstate transport system substrate-binding protein